MNQPIVLTKWNIGDVMFGPMQMVATADELLTAGIWAYDDQQRRVTRKCREIVARSENGTV